MEGWGIGAVHCRALWYKSTLHQGTVDSYLQGPKQVKDRKNGLKKVAWPLSN